MLAVVLIAMATIQPIELTPAKSPDGAVRALFDAREGARLSEAHTAYVAKSERHRLSRPLPAISAGRDGSLRTYSSLATG